MDKFGYIKGRRGPPGPAGKDALELNTWFPLSMVRMFREDEACTFYFDTETDGILYDKEKKPIGLKDRGGGKRNAKCLQNFQKPMKISSFRSSKYGLPLKDSLYFVDVETGIAPSSIFIVAFTFKVAAKLTDENHYIFSNASKTRAVSITNKSLNFWGSETLPELKYKYREWNTMIIQYSCISFEEEDRKYDKCFFILNGEKGFFRPRAYNIKDNELYIGGLKGGSNFANVVLGSFEVYFKTYDETPISYLIPEEIYNTIYAEIEL